MKLNINGILYAISFALDCIEKELIGVSSGHSKRVAYISTSMGRFLSLGQNQLTDLAACAIMHDSALTEFMSKEGYDKIKELEENNLKLHCILGEENIKKFPFSTNSKDAVLYHHENADGSGPFMKTIAETPLYAQLIHFADSLDANCNLGEISPGKLEKIYSYIAERRENIYPANHCDIFIKLFNKNSFNYFQNQDIDELLSRSIPNEEIEYEKEQLIEIMNVFAKIIDYKSSFTKNHSIEIAKKAYKMGEYYGYDDDTCIKLYIAGVLHDIGKMAINNDVLEKPDKLTDDEFRYMKNHAFYTYVILKKIDNFDDILRWASFHHEKLDGSGYPFGKKAEELGKNERLMACVDIYQALSEDRPYKKGMSHDESIAILREMSQKGLIDKAITEDIDNVFGC